MATGFSSTATLDNSHRYAPYQVADKTVVEQYIGPCIMDGERAYRCLWPQCQKDPFKGKHNLQVHVQKHLGHMKLFYCVSWCVHIINSILAFNSHRCSMQWAGIFVRRYRQAASKGRLWRQSISLRCLVNLHSKQKISQF